jgi:hypothetical protein
MFGQHIDPARFFQSFLSQLKSFKGVSRGYEELVYLIKKIAVNEVMPNSRD